MIDHAAPPIKTTPQAEVFAHSDPLPKRLYGLMAEFTEHDQLLHAARKTFAEGYRDIDAFSPFPIDGLPEAIGHEHSNIPFVTLIGGMIGGLGGYFMQWIAMARLYPLNVGGRPYNSWPNYIPITFELTILLASLTAFLAVFVFNKLPQLHHPVFNVPEFSRASIDRFFLLIEAEDPEFDITRTHAFLTTLGARKISEVET
ncbi:MAG: hypothetical protein JWO95_703 [Verrucomicrobiales bacterium]|nr:hypothetical protein [Verrucomicrobiales bacterium]